MGRWDMGKFHKTGRFGAGGDIEMLIRTLLANNGIDSSLRVVLKMIIRTTSYIYLLLVIYTFISCQHSQIGHQITSNASARSNKSRHNDNLYSTTK